MPVLGDDALKPEPELAGVIERGRADLALNVLVEAGSRRWIWRTAAI
jgi:hypothetical protein